MVALDEKFQHVTGNYIDEKCTSVSSSRYSTTKTNIDALMDLTYRFILK